METDPQQRQLPARLPLALPIVYLPPSLRPLAGGAERVRVEGATVRAAVDALDARHPGVKERLCPGGALSPELSVVVGGSVAGLGLLQRVGPEDEIHFVPALGGG